MNVEIPGELRGPLPRRVCTTRSGFWTITGTAIILVLALTATFWLVRVAVQHFQNWEALQRDGRETIGRVTGTKTGKFPMVDYAFTVNGTSYAGEAGASKQFLESVQDSSPLPIRYLPASPAVNHPAGWVGGPSDSVWFLLPFPVVLAGISVLISLRMERHLVVNGAPAAGVITKISEGGRAGYAAKYEFRTEDGRVMTKKVGVSGPVKVGSTVWVLYLRQNPRRSQIYPGSNYRVVE